MGSVNHWLGLASLLLLSGCGTLAPVAPQETAAEMSMDTARSAFAYGHYETAVESYSHALDYYQATGNTRATLTNLLNLAVVYRAMNQPQSAQACLQKMAALSSAQKESAATAELRREGYWMEAVLAVDEGRKNEAQRALEKARTGASANLQTRIAGLEAQMRPRRTTPTRRASWIPPSE